MGHKHTIFGHDSVWSYLENKTILVLKKHIVFVLSPTSTDMKLMT